MIIKFHTMQPKRLVWLGMAVGSFFGGLIPQLWGAGQFSLASILFTAAGGFFGIWFAYKLTQ